MQRFGRLKAPADGFRDQIVRTRLNHWITGVKIYKEEAKMTEPDKVIYSMHKVSKHYNRTVIIQDISLSYFYGAKIGVLGLNGSGKSTLAASLLELLSKYIPLNPIDYSCFHNAVAQVIRNPVKQACVPDGSSIWVTSWVSGFLNSTCLVPKPGVMCN